jgi:hypothetical protein
MESISYGGSGCPQGSVGQSIAEDRQSFTLIYDSFVAYTGSSAPITASRKNCQINLNLVYPEGFSYTITRFLYRGYVQLPSGVTAEQKAIYYFQGEVDQASATTRFVGPTAKDYLTGDSIEAAVYSPCGQVVPLNVNSQVRILNANGKAAQITTDSTDGKVTHQYYLDWQDC